MNLPTTLPIDDPEGLWALQLRLLCIAEEIFGPRDSSLQAYIPQLDRSEILTILTGLELDQPRFTDKGPQINFEFKSERKAVFAELSRNGERFWPTVLYELAHETIHLLNPGTLGSANYLEEGVAVAFSIHAQHLYSIPSVAIQKPEKSKGTQYWIALTLVNELPKPVLKHAGLLRQMAGSLRSVSSKHLLRMLPEIDAGLVDVLTCKFPTRTDA